MDANKLISVWHKVEDLKTGMDLCEKLNKQEIIDLEKLTNIFNYIGVSKFPVNDVINSFLATVAVACDDFKIITREKFEIAFCFSHIKATMYIFKYEQDVLGE